jgi:hypothetical protein
VKLVNYRVNLFDVPERYQGKIRKESDSQNFINPLSYAETRGVFLPEFWNCLEI